MWMIRSISVRVHHLHRELSNLGSSLSKTLKHLQENHPSLELHPVKWESIFKRRGVVTTVQQILVDNQGLNKLQFSPSYTRTEMQRHILTYQAVFSQVVPTRTWSSTLFTSVRNPHGVLSYDGSPQLRFCLFDYDLQSVTKIQTPMYQSSGGFCRFTVSPSCVQTATQRYTTMP